MSIWKENWRCEDVTQSWPHAGHRKVYHVRPAHFLWNKPDRCENAVTDQLSFCPYTQKEASHHSQKELVELDVNAGKTHKLAENCDEGENQVAAADSNQVAENARQEGDKNAHKSMAYWKYLKLNLTDVKLIFSTQRCRWWKIHSQICRRKSHPKQK